MQFIDLQYQQKRIHGKIMENISSVLKHGQYIMGPEIKELEKKLGGFAVTKTCRCLRIRYRCPSHGTDGL